MALYYTIPYSCYQINVLCQIDLHCVNRTYRYTPLARIDASDTYLETAVRRPLPDSCLMGKRTSASQTQLPANGCLAAF